jgi:hypothetical protein
MDERYYFAGDQHVQLYDVVGAQVVCDLCEEYKCGRNNIRFLAVKYGLDPDIAFYLISNVLGLQKITKPVTISLMSRV